MNRENLYPRFCTPQKGWLASNDFEVQDLNQHVQVYHHFKMETLTDAIRLMTPYLFCGVCRPLRTHITP